VIVVALAAFYVGLYFWGAHSDAYGFVVPAVRGSPVIQERVGDVQDVQLKFLGGFREKFVGSNKWATMLLVVTGPRGSVTVKVAVQKLNEKWTVSSASMDGQPITLN
jgi:hypothetical protein